MCCWYSCDINMRQSFIHHSFPEINRSRLIFLIVENRFYFYISCNVIFLGDNHILTFSNANGGCIGRISIFAFWIRAAIEIHFPCHIKACRKGSSAIKWRVPRKVERLRSLFAVLLGINFIVQIFTKLTNLSFFVSCRGMYCMCLLNLNLASFIKRWVYIHIH